MSVTAIVTSHIYSRIAPVLFVDHRRPLGGPVFLIASGYRHLVLLSARYSCLSPSRDTVRVPVICRVVILMLPRSRETREIIIQRPFCYEVTLLRTLVMVSIFCLFCGALKTSVLSRSLLFNVRRTDKAYVLNVI